MDLPENLIHQETHSLQSFVDRVFSEEPQDPRSYSLTLDTEYTNTPEDLKTVFEALATVFTLAMKLKHGDASGQVNLLNVSHTQFEKMQQYFRSFGFNVFYEATPYTQFDPDMDDPDALTENELPSLADISTEASPVDETTSRDLNDLPATEEDKLENFHINLKTERVGFRVWFSFLQ